jgi:rubrerythrin
MSTMDNLRLAFQEEAKNRVLFLLFAEKAHAEGKLEVARLFRAVAEAELIHARAQIDAIGAVKSTAENVRSAADIEEREFQGTYGKYLQEAIREGKGAIAELLRRIMEVERGHYYLFRRAAESLAKGQDAPPAEMLVCRSCGNTVLDRPEKCPVCGAAGEQFQRIP